MVGPGVDLAEVARDLSAQWLTEFGIEGPPVPVYELAVLLGATVSPERMTIETMALRHTSPRREIVVNIAAGFDFRTWRRRLRFAVAHEIMAMHLPYEGPDEDVGEAVLQGCASELLLYRPWLADDMADLGGDLPALAQRFEASHEATARAMLDIEAAVLTVVDSGQVSTRVGTPGIAYPRQLVSIEARAIQRAGEAWEAVEETGDALSVRAWPVEAPGSVRRVVALTYPEE